MNVTEFIKIDYYLQKILNSWKLLFFNNSNKVFKFENKNLNEELKELSF